MIRETYVTENAARVRERCHAAARRSGREADAVRIVAVTKTHPLQVALQALEAGITDFGENRVQETEAKWGQLPAGIARESITLHMVGRLQRNKARKAVALFDVIHSCDSIELAKRLAKPMTIQHGSPVVRVPTLLEVNLSGEPTKAGFAAAHLEAALEELSSLPNVELRGLMTVAPIVPSPEDARTYFVELRRLSERLRARHASLGPELSMGMTDDYEVAIEEGATIVRIGRAIFGPRL